MPTPRVRAAAARLVAAAVLVCPMIVMPVGPRPSLAAAREPIAAGSAPADLFVLSGSPYRGNAAMRGRPLRPEELFLVIDLDRPGLEAVRAAVTRGDMAGAARALLAFYRDRREPGWMTAHSFDRLPARRLAVRAAELPRLAASADDRRLATDAERHVFHILGGISTYPPHDYGPDIDWDANPVRDIEWPCGMHRLQYWDGAAVRCLSDTGDDRYAHLWVDLVGDWIRKNPITADRLPFAKSWDAIQVGIRGQRLATYLPRFLGSPACTPEFLLTLLTSLHDHARRIEQMPYPFADNFVFIETLGLAAIANLLPEFRDAPRWRAVALERFAAAQRRQVLPDGTQAELCPSYHVLVTCYALEFAELAGADTLTPEFRATAHRMVDACLAMVAPDRSLVTVGDTALGIDARPLLESAGRVLGRKDCLAFASDGRDARYPDRRNVACREGGFYALRSDWDPRAIWLGLHCGPAVREQFHSQFDRGTFELMAFGRRLMVDPGVFSYANGTAGREEFRRTATHQCLTLDGANAIQAGRCLQWLEDDGAGNAVLTVENTSYPGLAHRRTVFFVQRRWFVLMDEALGAATGDIDLHFQLAPGPAVIDPAAKIARSDFADGGNVLVWAARDAAFTLEAEERWFSPRWQAREPLPAFRFRHDRRTGPARFLTVLAPYEGREPPAVAARVVAGQPGGDDVAVELRYDAAVHRCGRSLPDTTPPPTALPDARPTN